jgi:hypothetical protein
LFTTSRFGSTTDDAATVCWFAPETAPAFVTAAVCAEVADVEPLEFVAVTLTRIVFARSPDWTTYVCEVALEIAAQLLPWASQLCHWYVIVGVVSLVNVPGDAVSVWPTCGVPLTVGGAVLVGA